MPNQLIAWHGDQAEEYFAKISLATPDQINQAQSLFGLTDGNDEKIYSITGESAEININGPLTKNGPSALAKFFGFKGTGYVEIMDAVDAIKNAGVKNVTINADSGGGMVDGCDQCYQKLLTLREDAKVTFINRGMIASAMYWLACAGDEIISDSLLNFTGSIGVKIAAWDFKPYYESLGIKERVLLSDNAQNKAPSISDEKGRAELTKQLNSIERVFHARVAEGRGVSVETIKADFGQGAVFVARDLDETKPDALSNGLIDGIIGFSENDSGSSQAKASEEKENKSASAVNEVDNKTVEPVLKTEGKKMARLKDILAGDNEAKADFDAEVQTAVDDAVADMDAQNKRNAQLAKVALSAEKNYGATIRTLAAGLMTGENSAEELKSAMAAVDAVREENASNQSQSESEDLGPTGGENLDSKTTPESNNGVISTEEQYAANVEAIRKRNGVSA